MLPLLVWQLTYVGSLLISRRHQNFVVSSRRKFVREGMITEVELPSGEKKQCYLFLFNDLLVWTKPKKSNYKFKKLAYLNTITVTQEEYSTVRSSYLLIPHIEGKFVAQLNVNEHSSYLFAQTDAETKEWINEIFAYRAEELQQDNWSNVTKRKTFMHAELVQALIKQEDKKEDKKEKKGKNRSTVCSSLFNQSETLIERNKQYCDSFH